MRILDGLIDEQRIGCSVAGAIFPALETGNGVFDEARSRFVQSCSEPLGTTVQS